MLPEKPEASLQASVTSPRRVADSVTGAPSHIAPGTGLGPRGCSLNASPLPLPLAGAGDEYQRLGGARLPEHGPWSWAAQQLSSGLLPQRQAKTPVLTPGNEQLCETGSPAAPAGVAEINDSVTLAT